MGLLWRGKIFKMLPVFGTWHKSRGSCGLYCSAGSIANISDYLRAILQWGLYCRATLNTAATVHNKSEKVHGHFGWGQKNQEHTVICNILKAHVLKHKCTVQMCPLIKWNVFNYHTVKNYFEVQKEANDPFRFLNELRWAMGKLREFLRVPQNSFKVALVPWNRASRVLLTSKFDIWQICSPLSWEEA